MMSEFPLSFRQINFNLLEPLYWSCFSFITFFLLKVLSWNFLTFIFYIFTSFLENFNWPHVKLTFLSFLIGKINFFLRIWLPVYVTWQLFLWKKLYILLAPYNIYQKQKTPRICHMTIIFMEKTLHFVSPIITYQKQKTEWVYLIPKNNYGPFSETGSKNRQGVHA